MMKHDQIGTYDDEALPKEFSYPLKVDSGNDAICGANNRIYATYTLASEITHRLLAKRRAEFIVRLANGELIIDYRGFVLKRIDAQLQEGRLIVTYEPVGSGNILNHGQDSPSMSGNGDSSQDQPGLVEKVIQVVKRRGRPRKVKR